MIKTVYDIENGDILFKNTEMGDRGKSFFMKIINEITTGIQNIQRWFKGLPKISGRDHTEFLLWNGTILETHSSVKGQGVRSQNFMKWMERQAYPEIEILRRPDRLDPEAITILHRQIIADRGIPYATKPAIREGFTSGHDSIDLTVSQMMIRGIFCSESTKRYAGYRPFTGMYPGELYDFLIKEGYRSVFRANCQELIK